MNRKRVSYIFFLHPQYSLITEQFKNKLKPVINYIFSHVKPIKERNIFIQTKFYVNCDRHKLIL